MKINYAKKLPCLLLIIFFVINTAAIRSQVVLTFSVTNAVQYFTVPACVAAITVEARGAGGVAGTSPAGLGGIATGVMSVTAGQVLAIYVGGNNGFNGGAQGVAPGGNGGGGSDVRFAPWTLNDRQIVAGGGGGGGATNGNAPGGAGGGGTAVGANFVGGAGGKGANGLGPPVGGANGGSQGGAGGVGNGSNNGGAGGGGGMLSGGGGGTNTGYVTGANGSLGLGGAGGGATGPGGGGGGYYGGGGASGGTNSNAGGGGGSSWTGTLTTPGFTAGVVSGDGLVKLTYVFMGNSVVSSFSPTAICTGQSATLSASGMNSYTWSTGSNNASIVVNPTVTTTYTVFGTNSVNCVSNVVTTLTVSPALPVLSVSSSTNQVCLGKTVTLTASGALSYTWSNGVNNGQSYTPSVTNTYTVTGGNGCGTTSVVTTITVAPLPVSVASSPTVVCAGSPSTLTAVAAATGFTWQPFNVTNTMMIVNPSVTTVYTITVSDGTCAGTNTIALQTLQVPTLNLVGTSTNVCEGYAVTMTVTGASTYTWLPGPLSGSMVTVVPTAPTLYSVVGTNTLGCSSLAQWIVLTSPSPTVTVIPTTTLVCPGANVLLSASGATTYLWNTGPTYIHAFSVNPTVTTVYTVTGTDTNNGCTATKAATVVVFTPSVTLTGASTVCAGSNATLTASGASNYNWDNGSTSPLLIVTPSITTTYTLSTTTVSNNVTCGLVNTVQVVVNPKPNVIASANKSVSCKPDPVQLFASGAASYLWSNGSNSPSLIINPTVTIIYNVTGTDANGCVNTATVKIQVNTCPGFEEFNISPYSISVFPNPGSGDIMISAQSAIRLILYNDLGQAVKTIELNENNGHHVSLSDLAAGVYLLSGQNTLGKVNEKIIITR